MYEPKPGGKLELIAVEYITTKGPLRWRASVQLQRYAQSLRTAAVLRAACLGLESEPARRLRGYEPEGQLRARGDDIAGHALGVRCSVAAASIERTDRRAMAIQQH